MQFNGSPNSICTVFTTRISARPILSCVIAACMQKYRPRMSRLALLCIFSCLCAVCTTVTQAAVEASDLGDRARDNAASTARRLYVTLRNIAFPNHLLTDQTKNLGSRFLLLTPGKVLNYFDYFPGKEYTKFIQDYHTRRRESVVPPRIMEKWFDLADVMPNPNPLNGQDTGKSLANVYKSILHEIKLKGLEEKTETESHYYNQGVQFLNHQIEDPENLSQNITRLALYERYRDHYNDRKLEMEDIIEGKRLNLGSLNYELWFQRHYPSLQSRVESAYTKWMVFGQKELVELNIAYLDTGSSGQIIEQARMAMRASGVVSLDRTRTIYPVSFEPSDWYKYLLPERQRPSTDQLQVMLGKLQSRIDATEAMIDYVNGISADDAISSHVTQLRSNYNATQSAAKTKIRDYLSKMYKCMIDKTGNGSDCKDYKNKKSEALASLVAESDSFVSAESIGFLTKTDGAYVESLKREAKRLKDESSKIYSLLGEASPYLGGIIDSSPLAIANLTDEYKDDKWLQFEFDSASSHQTSSDVQTSVSVASGFRSSFFFGSVRGSYSSQTNTRSHNEKLAMSNLKAKGELLRVNIKRPWFRPEVFDDPGLTYLQSDGEGHQTYVSPGREYDEVGYYNTLLKTDKRYKLPEYVTSFLLARNIELEFSGLDTSTSTYFMSQMSHQSVSGGFFFFSFSSSKTKSKQVSHIQASKTATGLNIKIPGAQIIGYYTETVPLFPQDQQ